jgi:hypothetical protein
MPMPRFPLTGGRAYAAFSGGPYYCYRLAIVALLVEYAGNPHGERPRFRYGAA